MEAREWFKVFRKESSASFADDEGSELGACRLRYRKRREVPGSIQGDEWDSHNAEWTTVMGSFLARMAGFLGMIQEWEWAPTSALRGRDDIPPDYVNLLPHAGGIDFAWFADAASRPSVLIEHENDVTTNNGKKLIEDVEKLLVRLLLCPEKSLAVLFTYPWGGHVGFSGDEIANAIASVAPLTKDSKDQFLLVLGDLGENGWARLTWDGRLWNGNGWDRL